jgi:hypothetical protein
MALTGGTALIIVIFFVLLLLAGAVSRVSRNYNYLYGAVALILIVALASLFISFRNGGVR